MFGLPNLHNCWVSHPANNSKGQPAGHLTFVELKVHNKYEMLVHLTSGFVGKVNV